MHDAYRPTDDVLLNVSLDFPHNRINAWIWSERTNTRWSLIKNPSGKDFNEILHKVNKWRCQAEYKNGLDGLFSVVINKMASQHKVGFGWD